jgi:hypothetical protein
MGTPVDLLTLHSTRLDPDPPPHLAGRMFPQPGQRLLRRDQMEQRPPGWADCMGQGFWCAFLLREANVLHAHLLAVVPRDGRIGSDPCWHDGGQARNAARTFLPPTSGG